MSSIKEDHDGPDMDLMRADFNSSKTSLRFCKIQSRATINSKLSPAPIHILLVLFPSSSRAERLLGSSRGGRAAKDGWGCVYASELLGERWPLPGASVARASASGARATIAAGCGKSASTRSVSGLCADRTETAIAWGDAAVMAGMAAMAGSTEVVNAEP
jgi:hypothetical protein